MVLTVEMREQFLAEPHIGALSVVERPDRAPLVVPIWYQYTPGGELWVRAPPDTRKARAVRETGRFTLMAQRTSPTVRYVSVEGPVRRYEPSTDAESREMVARYLPPDKVEAFLEFERTHLGEHHVISLRPQHWFSADLGPACSP
ncbi:pyridoxamine 5'-phosphate oxidase family protein [Amycolatopsis carbonis]|uniref:Pyridoxamine 5'-phosphate oxidase family protein n=1 Tax=Amycolatopsis carbonis TaxID=715471 RepID=A0A9Y2N223_9PSEU|nr:pyridoxamine 5'-phosphate oxidase family protein [Amycolatopsis sp. 2-15]WIX83589.1 pyridoxamine 5'-phosphate oxidase family protein [Amycolatopsis sp. 2-15]